MKTQWIVGLTVALLALASSSNATASADLSLSASIQAFDYATEANLTYTLTVSNAGPSAATGLVQMVMQPSAGDELTNLF